MKKRKINYGYIYLSLIPAFAVIYSLLPEGYIDYADLNNNFIINLYYSAVTVTTLGYGDITPLNEVSALLVGAEAVAGVVVIGLFLNQIAHTRMTLDKAKEHELVTAKERLHECDKLLQYAAVIRRIEDPEELESSLKDFILTIDMHDYRVLERICIKYLSDKDMKIFREKFSHEISKIESQYAALNSKINGRYWG